MAEAELQFGPRIVYRGRAVVAAFQLDRDGIARCAVGRELRHAVFDIASGEAYLYARAHAPFDDGDYSAAFKAEAKITVLPKDYPMARWAGVLLNDAPHATAVEFGSGKKGDKQGHFVLRRTLQHLNRLSRL